MRFDPRLSRYGRATRGYLIISAGLGLVAVALVIAQATLIASSISQVFLDGAGLAQLRGSLVVLALVVVSRAGAAWAQEVIAYRASAAVKTELRSHLMTHALRLGPAWLRGARAGEIATLATRGLDALDVYFARYLPQVILAGLVPTAILLWIFPIDVVAAMTIAVTLPLIPLFMALVGLSTQRLNRQQFAALERLGRHLLELIAGLPTLKIFNRARGQARAIAELTDDQRRLTMRTLRLAFLSSLVLELLATFSVALVAVGIGVRVVSGGLDLRTALIVLILAPEAYLPLRQLGTQYHASAEGLAAAQRVFQVLETEPPATGGRTDLPERAPIVFDSVEVAYPDRNEPALGPVSLRIDPEEIIAIVGPSGSGKTSIVNLLMRFTAPTAGRVVLGDGRHAVDLSEVDAKVWRSRIAFVPQNPYLFAGTVEDNIRLGSHAPADAVGQAVRQARLDDLPDGLSTVVGEGGAGLSAGQRQRVAMARAFLRAGPMVVLDEPTANLDPATEADLIASILQLARGRTMVIVAHRPALIAAANRTVVLGEPRPVLAVAA